MGRGASRFAQGGQLLTALTPTGARPEAFAQCVEWMRAQTINARWVIVDDGPEPMPKPRIDGWQIVYLRPDPLWQPGQNTQKRNLLAGLGFCGDRIAVIEDDDQYAPDWLERVNGWLDHDDLVGEGGSVYHNLRTGNTRNMNNTRHASLCATAVKGKAIDWLRAACKGSAPVDIALWQNPGKVYPHSGGVIGLKGYPGRPGIGIGHKL